MFFFQARRNIIISELKETNKEQDKVRGEQSAQAINHLRMKQDEFQKQHHEYRVLEWKLTKCEAQTNVTAGHWRLLADALRLRGEELEAYRCTLTRNEPELLDKTAGLVRSVLRWAWLCDRRSEKAFETSALIAAAHSIMRIDAPSDKVKGTWNNVNANNGVKGASPIEVGPESDNIPPEQPIVTRPVQAILKNNGLGHEMGQRSSVIGGHMSDHDLQQHQAATPNHVPDYEARADFEENPEGAQEKSEGAKLSATTTQAGAAHVCSQCEHSTASFSCYGCGAPGIRQENGGHCNPDHLTKNE